MESEGLLLCSHEPANEPQHETDESTQAGTHTHFFLDKSLVRLPDKTILMPTELQH